MRPTTAAALIVLTAVLSGCGDDEPTSDTSTSTAGPATETADRLCPKLGEDFDESAYRERAEGVLVGVPFARAEELAAASRCRLEAGVIDGEPQVQTREYDPSRITVAVSEGVVRRVLGFG